MELPVDAALRYPLRRHSPRANRFRDITLGHLNKFIGGDYSSQNISSVLVEGKDDSESSVQMEVWSAPNLSKPTFAEAVQQKYKKITKGFKFGPSWSNHWVRVTLNVKKEWKDKERVQFEFDPGCEAMIFTTEGLPLQGITGGTEPSRRVEYIIPGEDRLYPLKLYIEVSANAMFGVPDEGRTDVHDDVYFVLASADIVVPRLEAWHLMWDFRTILDITQNLPKTNPTCLKAQSVAMEISNHFDPLDVSTIQVCRQIAEKILGKDWSIHQDRVYDSTSDWNRFSDQSVPVLAIGHCHIDTAWLWPFSVTQQKIARSWSTQLDLMDRYPEFRFIGSTPQQYKWLEEFYPQLFSKVRRHVEMNKFFITGGAWVENDTNLPSGESLCRQFIYGQRYFKSRFGKLTNIYWLPDSFGYSSQIPQICRLVGIPYFFTQKLSWSQFNTFPHSTFNWIGIDGTQILVHMTPVDTYTAQASVADVLKAITNHKDLEWCDKSLLVFGNGDGGGGPLPAMIESLRRIRAAANHSPECGIPKVTIGPSVSDFYDLILEKSRNGMDLPTWRGELYLEYHRGTYTSHGSIKRHNRKTEVLMREIEYYAALASILNPNGDGYEYPKDELDSLWEDVLLCQFHDVLPGSAIAKVYQDAEKIYADIWKKGLVLLESAREALLPGSQLVKSVSDPRSAGTLFSLNTLSFPRREVVKIPMEQYDGRSAFSASDADEDTGFVVAKDVKGNGIIEFEDLLTFSENHKFATASVVRDEVGKIYYILANAFLTVKISGEGRIVSLVDVGLGRELLLPGTSAGFVIYQDQPLNFDAWDVDVFHLDTKKLINAQSIQVSESKGLRASLLIQYLYNNSKISATVSLDAVPGSLKPDALSMVRFDTVVEWSEKHKFLKFELPLDLNTDEATYEIQYGTLKRPTHKNTPWDAAKFEVCGHRFADVSEFGYGVAILNDCKYGYACEGSYLRLSLLRSSTYPDPKQDEGRHEMSFAILPHRGHFLESDVPQSAISFNNPLHLRSFIHRNSPPKPTLSSTSTLLETGLIDFKNQWDLMNPIFKLKSEGIRHHVILDHIKRGEDDTFGFHSKRKLVRNIIVRLYEAFGGSTNVKLITTLPVKEAYIVDILERDLEKLEILKIKQKIKKDDDRNQNQNQKRISHYDKEQNVQMNQEGEESLIHLKFKAFQILTIRLNFN